MAFYTWLSLSRGDSLNELFSASLFELGLEISLEASNEQQIYAVEKYKKGVIQSTRVNVIIGWVCSTKSSYQIEVRSSEPMFKRNTRCEQFANLLKKISPPSN